MRLRKNLGAKMAALAASLVALIGAWGLVHQNPPASANDSASSEPAVQPTASTGRRAIPTPRVATNAPVKKHTRTHVS